MILSKEKIGILVVVLVAAGGILIFAGQQNKALLTADISEVVDSKSKKAEKTQPEKPKKDATTEIQTPEQDVTELSLSQDSSKKSPQDSSKESPQAEPEPQPQPQASASQKVWVSPASVPAGGDITVTVDTLDTSGFVLFVDIYAKNVNSGRIVKGTIVNIDGDGRSFGSLSIPSNVKQGTWFIEKVSITDISGNTTEYYDGQDMSAVFTVTSP